MLATWATSWELDYPAVRVFSDEFIEGLSLRSIKLYAVDGLASPFTVHGDIQGQPLRSERHQADHVFMDADFIS